MSKQLLERAISILISMILAIGCLIVPVYLSYFSETAYAISEASRQTVDENGESLNPQDIAAQSDENSQGKLIANRGDYIGINVNAIFSSDETGQAHGGQLWTGLVDFLKILTNAILLPFAIVYTTWRALYIAIFCYIAHIDPLNMLSNKRYSKDGEYEAKKHGVIDFSSLGTFREAPTADQYKRAAQLGAMSGLWRGTNRKGNLVDWQTGMNMRAQHALLMELKFMGTGLFIVIAVWSLINIGLWVAVMLLQSFGGVG